jgi:biopolymer transport protein ExbD
MQRRRQTLVSSQEEIQINLTPLIDVVFVVLIIFIVIAPMLELDRVQLASGAHQDHREMTTIQEESPIAIHVHEDDSIWFNRKLVSEAQLIDLLKHMHRQYPTRIPQLFHDKKAHFGTYQTVKNAVELSGFEQLDVILQPG